MYWEEAFTFLAPSSYSAMSAAGLSISSGAMVLIIAFVGSIGLWIQSKRLLITVNIFNLNKVYFKSNFCLKNGFLYRILYLKKI